MIKAIQTQYKGYNFRSRLEARWAVAFDRMGVNWRYEPECFDLGKFGHYLPDFRIEYKGKRAWVEVKGRLSGYRREDRTCVVKRYQGQEKTDEFAMQIGARGGMMFLLGDIPNPYCREIRPISTMFVTTINNPQLSGYSQKSLWEYCAFTMVDAENLTPSFICGDWGRDYIPNGQKCSEDFWNLSNPIEWWPFGPYKAARSARFER